MNEITYSIYKDKQYRFFFPLVQECLLYEGNGDITNNDIFFVSIIVHPSEPHKAIIITTCRAYDRKSIEFQNIDTLLRSKYSFTSVTTVFSGVEDIHAILHDGLSESKNENTDDEMGDNKTSALQDLENIVTEAVKRNASDIHFYVYKDRAEVVLRVNGLLEKPIPLARDQANAIISAGLNTKSSDYRSITDEEEMVDTSLELFIDVEGKDGKTFREKIILRLAKSAASDGPHTVMRVIRTSQSSTLNLDSLGIEDEIIQQLKDDVNSASGIILVTGPVNSGKSTLLTALYESLDHQRKALILEDPIEYKINRPNTVQKRVYPEKPKLDFIDYLKNALRQDADVIGISEIRDRKVAEMVVKFALTGHLMISTIHANDSIGTICRLKDEGLSNTILAERNLLRCIVSLRLVPKLCHNCSLPLSPSTRERKRNKDGCKSCNHTGYSGRQVVAEILSFNEPLLEYIKNDDLIGLEKHLHQEKWESLSLKARRLVKNGIIDAEDAKINIPSFKLGANYESI